MKYELHDSVRDRMAELGISQVEMIRLLRKRNISVQPPFMSSVLSGAYSTPKAEKVLKVCDSILAEEARKNDRARAGAD